MSQEDAVRTIVENAIHRMRMESPDAVRGPIFDSDAVALASAVLEALDQHGYEIVRKDAGEDL